jgi:hypothetical protein
MVTDIFQPAFNFESEVECDSTDRNVLKEKWNG